MDMFFSDLYRQIGLKTEMVDDSQSRMSSHYKLPSWSLKRRPASPCQGISDPCNPLSKRVACWAIEGSIEITSVVSNTFQMQWPPASGKVMAFPEIDKAAWFPMTEAREKINERQISFLEQVIQQNPVMAGGKERP